MRILTQAPPGGCNGNSKQIFSNTKQVSAANSRTAKNSSILHYRHYRLRQFSVFPGKTKEQQRQSTSTLVEDKGKKRLKTWFEAQKDYVFFKVCLLYE